MAYKRTRDKLFVANSTFLVEGNVWVRAGDTVVEGHPLLRGRLDLFRPFAPTFGELPTEPDPDPQPAASEPEAPAADSDVPAEASA